MHMLFAQVIEQQAHEVATKLPGAADKASEQIQGTAHELATNAEPAADKLSQAAVQSAERAAELAVPTGDKASDVLKTGAKQAADNADEYGQRVGPAAKACRQCCVLFKKIGPERGGREALFDPASPSCHSLIFAPASAEALRS